MKALLIIILTTLISTNVLATAQFADIIIYGGKEYALFNNPLEEFFEKNPDKRPKNEIVSTALWRGYVATFEIKNNTLIVRDIEVQISDTTSKEGYNLIWKSVLSDVFPDKKEVKVDWLTGLLVLPYGKLVNYVHMGYASTYKKYFLLEVENGNLKKEMKFNHKKYEKFKKRQFLEFKKTDEYKKLKEELKKDGSSDEFIDSFLRSFVINYSTKILTE